MEQKRPKPEENSRQKEIEDKIADLVAEALYEAIIKKGAKSKWQ